MASLNGTVRANGVDEASLATIWKWNADLPLTIDTCIHDLISEKAASHPEKLAISSWDGTFNYREVETLSNTLAAHLLEQNVGCKDIVVLWSVLTLLPYSSIWIADNHISASRSQDGRPSPFWPC